MQPYLHHKPHAQAPVLVVLPGVNSGPYLFEDIVQTPIGQTHELVVVNPPGCGGTPLLTPLTAQTYASSILMLLDGMGITEFDLLGHSLGSFAAQEMARMAPERVRRLILASTSVGQPYMARDTLAIRKHVGMGFWELSKAIGADPATFMKHFFGPAYPTSNPQGYMEFLKRRADNLAPKNVTMAQFAAGGAFSSYHWAHRIAQPTLVIQGGADILTPPGSARKLASFMPQARYLEFYGVGHFPMLEHEGFYPAISRFLQGHLEGDVVDGHVNIWQRFRRSWMDLHG